jgi:hypothetical protein
MAMGVVALELTDGLEVEGPVVQRLPAHAERVLLALLRARNEPVERGRDVDSRPT